MNEAEIQEQHRSVLSDLRKLAAIGVKQPAESKYNLFRASWLRQVISRGWSMWDSVKYYEKEYRAMPSWIREKVEFEAQHGS